MKRQHPQRRVGNQRERWPDRPHDWRAWAWLLRHPDSCQWPHCGVPFSICAGSESQLSSVTIFIWLKKISHPSVYHIFQASLKKKKVLSWKKPLKKEAYWKKADWKNIEKNTWNKKHWKTNEKHFWKKKPLRNKQKQDNVPTDKKTTKKRPIENKMQKISKKKIYWNHKTYWKKET